MLHASRHVHLITQWRTAGILSAYSTHCVQFNLFPSGQPLTDTDLLIHYKTQCLNSLMLVVAEKQFHRCADVLTKGDIQGSRAPRTILAVKLCSYATSNHYRCTREKSYNAGKADEDLMWWP